MTGPLVINQNAAALPAPAGSPQLRLGGVDGSVGGLLVDTFGVNSDPYLTLRHARGTGAARAALQAYDPLGVITAWGATSSTAYTVGTGIYFYTRENWTASATGSYIHFMTCAPGTNTYENPAIIGRGLMINTAIGNDPGPGSIAMSGNLLPTVTGTQNIGSTGLRWGTVYTSDLSLNNGIGNWTIVEGENDLFIYNNKTNRTFKFTLEEVDPMTVPAKKT